MAPRSTIFAVSLTLALGACGDETGPNPVGALAITKGPYLQHMTPEAVTILWETSLPADGRVEVLAEGQWHSTVGPTGATIHEIRIQDRGPSEELTYVVESTGDHGAVVTSDQATLQMAPELGTPFRFCLWGDSQERPEVFSQLVAHMMDHQPDLLVGLGDFVWSGSDYSQWGERFFGPLQPLIQHTPMIAALGNHDESSSWFFDLLAQPGNEQWFSYRYGNAFFLVLDTNEPFAVGTEQYQYALEALLSDPAQSATWLFAAHHHPPYSEIYEEPIYEQIRRELIPLYEHAGVDVNFHGHIHDYERGEHLPPQTGRRIWQVQTSGGGGTLWWDEYDGEWDQIDLVIQDQHHMVVVEAGTSELTLQAINLQGEAMDVITLQAEPRSGEPPPTP
jgi:hypothetical protein